MMPNTREDSKAEGTECPRCPFYGFHHPEGKLNIFRNGHTDQCGLVIGSYARCGMENSGKIPNWNECYSNNDAMGKELSTKFAEAKFYPRAFEQENGVPGVPIRDWMDYVMKGKPFIATPENP